MKELPKFNHEGYQWGDDSTKINYIAEILKQVIDYLAEHEVKEVTNEYCFGCGGQPHDGKCNLARRTPVKEGCGFGCRGDDVAVLCKRHIPVKEEEIPVSRPTTKVLGCDVIHDPTLKPGEWRMESGQMYSNPPVKEDNEAIHEMMSEMYGTKEDSIEELLEEYVIAVMGGEYRRKQEILHTLKNREIKQYERGRNQASERLTGLVKEAKRETVEELIVTAGVMPKGGGEAFADVIEKYKARILS